VLLFSISNISFAQEQFCQAPVEFIGEPSPGFCSGPLPVCTTILGTSISESSQLPSNILSGTICIQGNFTITAGTNFTFQNATILVEPNLEIIVASGASLVLDQASIYGCGGLWKGIKLLNNTSIQTLNNSRIEDANKAINASFVSAILEINNTTFNRNLNGIWLEDSPTAPNPPRIAYIANSSFTCNAPIVGTTKTISDHGIYSLNCPVSFQQGAELEDNNLNFVGLKYGIKIEGTRIASLIGNNFRFRQISYVGIKMSRGSINLRASTFINYGDRGISLMSGTGLWLRGCNFRLLETDPKFFPAPSPEFRRAIAFSPDFQSLAIVPEVQIHEKCSFVYNCPGIDEVYTGISISGSTRFNTTIHDNDFVVNGQNSAGITIQGVSHPQSALEILDNRFTVSAPFPPFQSSFQSYGIFAAQEINNLHIVGNDFSGGGELGDEDHKVINDGVNISQTSGFGNMMIDNDFFGDFWSGVEMNNSENWKLCSNNGFGVDRVFLFRGENLGLDFIQNSCLLGGFDIQGKIFTQSQKDNSFFGAFPFIPSYARCVNSDCATNSRFFVRHPKSVSSVFYPQVELCGAGPVPVNCLPMELFFIEQAGSPPAPCAEELQDPGDEDFLLSIANGIIDAPNSYLSKEWRYKNHLYAILNESVGILNSHSSFVTFLQNEASTSVGQFFTVKKLLNEAIGSPSAGIDFQKLQIALNLNNNINAIAIFEQNQKIVNQILLLALLNQDGVFTEMQIESLEQIANQCPENGGLAVGQANSLLVNNICSSLNNNPFGNCGEVGIPPLQFESLEERAGFSKITTGFGQLKAFEVNDILTIVLPVDQSGFLNIFDMGGIEIFARKIVGNEDNLQIDVSSFPSGIYFASFNGIVRSSTKIMLTH
jgi:hypothetical protein